MEIMLITTGPNMVAEKMTEMDAEIIDLGKNFLTKSALLSALRSHLPKCRQKAVLITYRCPYIIPSDIRSHFKVCMNIHPLSLPKYAGLNPWPQFMESGDTESEVVIHEMTDTPDSGNILATMKYTATADMPATRRSSDIAASKLLDSLMHHI